ncbi:MAG: FliA/WhiG family RNA polymerase sigma factor [Peptococcia bacterium]
MENKEMWRKYSNSKSQELKEQLVIEYLPLVKRVANKVATYIPSHVSRDDLNSNGIIGLLEAVERYDVELGIPFPAYASKRIKGSIIDAMRREDWIPLSLRKKAKILEEAYANLENELGRSARDEEIAAYLQISLEELDIWLKEIQFISIISLEEPLFEGDNVSHGEYIVDQNSPNPEKIFEINELKTILAQAVNDLPEKEKTVVSLFYYNDLTNKEIAEVMDLSDSRISQLHTKAIFRLRGKLSRQKRNL